MTDLREVMVSHHPRVPLDLQHECIEYLIASYNEQPSLRGHVSKHNYDEMMKQKCKIAYDKTIIYLNKKLKN